MIWGMIIIVSAYVDTKDVGVWLGNNLPLIILQLICVLFLMIAGGMWIFHTYLMCNNSTTWEMLKYQSIPYLRGLGIMPTPFDRGVVANVRTMCCTWSFAALFASPPREEEYSAHRVIDWSEWLPKQQTELVNQNSSTTTTTTRTIGTPMVV
eukprot:TRINITY_DN5737_c0_g1_i2.p1 TRINITY_DN5737_c0_g1~~TRINITY_DN5737_c0_g1_i2.p1  ORF type:complete len:152 (-),score=32.09 TRINITY_DN5737_c0_g1_i2:199-654(-)